MMYNTYRNNSSFTTRLAWPSQRESAMESSRILPCCSRHTLVEVNFRIIYDYKNLNLKNNNFVNKINTLSLINPMQPITDT